MDMGLRECGKLTQELVQERTYYKDGKQVYLGRYESLMEAACARLAAEQCLDWASCEAKTSSYRYIKGE